MNAINKINQSIGNLFFRMVRILVIILAGIIISPLTFSQTTSYPRGGYKDFAELMKKQPSMPFVFTIKIRTKGAKIMGGGAQYRIYCNDGSLEPSVVEYQIYAISTGDTLYLNCYLQKAQRWYAKIITEGKYLGFWGPVNNGDVAVQNSQRKYNGAFGAVDRNIDNLKVKVLYVLDNSFGIGKPLNRVMLKKMLEPYPGLQQEYLNEPNMEDPDTMLNYLTLINSYSEN